jgi:hypothetical protein
MAASPARGSPKAKAANTEASTTFLAAIAFLPNYLAGFVVSLDAQSEEFSAHFGNRSSFGTNRFLQDIEQFTLKRTMMGRCTAAQLSDEPFGHSLNGQIHSGHRKRLFASVLAPIRNQSIISVIRLETRNLAFISQLLTGTHAARRKFRKLEALAQPTALLRSRSRSMETW